MSPAEKPIPTSLKLPPALKGMIDEAARQAGVSSHAYMVNTLAEAAQRAKLREQFDHDTEDALLDVQTNGLGHDLADVKAYFAQMAQFRAGLAERPVPLVPKKWA